MEAFSVKNRAFIEIKHNLVNTWNFIVIAWNLQNTMITTSLWVNSIEMVHDQVDSDPSYVYIEQITDVMQIGLKDPAYSYSLNGYLKIYKMIRGTNYITSSKFHHIFIIFIYFKASCLNNCHLSAGWLNPICLNWLVLANPCTPSSYQDPITNECTSKKIPNFIINH